MSNPAPNCPAPREGQSWPVVPAHLISLAAGLPRAVLVEAGETPPRRPDASLASPLEPGSMRGLVQPAGAPLPCRCAPAPAAPGFIAATAQAALVAGLAVGLLLACTWVGWSE